MSQVFVVSSTLASCMKENEQTIRSTISTTINHHSSDWRLFDDRVAIILRIRKVDRLQTDLLPAEATEPLVGCQGSRRVRKGAATD